MNDMSMELRGTLLIIVVIFMCLILNMIRKKSIHTKYALLWLLSATAMMIAAIFPNLFTLFSQLLGFEATSNMIFLFGFFILLCLCFSMTLIISKQKKELTTLIQQVSLLQYRFEHDKEKN